MARQPTVRGVDLDPSGSSDTHDFSELGYSGPFVFAASVNGDTELWISDGTAAGTTLLRDIETLGTSYPSGMTRCGNKVVS